MSYRGYFTGDFEKDFEKLDNSIKVEIKKSLMILEENPYVGKPLGYRFFRERKIRGYRVYYLIYDDISVFYVIAISTKKGQQSTINKIKSLILYYNEEIRKKVNQL